MLAKRIIPCLDVKNGRVVKGVKFQNHQDVGDILHLAQYYNTQGADELVFYDITASAEQRSLDRSWVRKIAEQLTIPFCVAGGIRTVKEAEAVLHAGADKISINSPALENPGLIDQLVKIFGQQCVVIGVDSFYVEGKYKVYQYTGDPNTALASGRLTQDWLREVQHRGAGEVVLNCMNQDGVRKGYDIEQLALMREILEIPLVASGGAGCAEDFVTLFRTTNADGALAASVFHNQTLLIPELKKYLSQQKIQIRPRRDHRTPVRSTASHNRTGVR